MDTATLSFDRGTLVLSCAGDAPPGPWRRDERIGGYRAEAIHYATVSESFAGIAGFRFRDEVPPPAEVRWPRVALPNLRPEQADAVAAWKRRRGRGVVVMPTGTGKTEVALSIMASQATAAIVVAPVRDLMYQWHRRILKGLGYDAGIVGDSIRNVKPVTVTTYDSAYAHMPELGDRFGLLIFDEVHHLPGRARREAALFSTAKMRLGLTATPTRADGRHVDLDHLVGPTVYDLPISKVRGRDLADYDVVRIPVALSEEERRAYDRAGGVVQGFIREKREAEPHYDFQDLSAEAGRDPAARRAQKAFYLRKSIEDRAKEKLRVLEDLFRLHGRQPTIVFAGTNRMAMEVSRRFLAPTILSHTRKKERLEVLDGFGSGRFPVLVANRVLDEGVDVPEAKVAVVIGGLSSARQAKQRLGRILRKRGASRAVLYEVVTEGTGEEERSRARRRSDAYERPIHRQV